MTVSSSRMPAFADIEDAAARLAGVAVETPLLEVPQLNELVGGRLLAKAEPLQHTGSFKFRGAYNKISRLSDAARKAGVVAFSSGNHAQGTARAARMLGVPAVIVMPQDAPEIKIRNTRAYGAEVVLYDRTKDDRAALAADLAEARGLTPVPPYDDPDVVAGQGTVGREIASQAEAMGVAPDAVVVCCSGGGLLAGCALALERLAPDTAVYAAEPEGFDDTARSLASGTRLANPPGGTSFCDALLVDRPGALTFPINRRLVRGGLVVSDREAARAMALAFEYLKVVVEPGGAVALAAALSGKLDCKDRTVAVVLSGGNVDPATFGAVLAER